MFVRSGLLRSIWVPLLASSALAQDAAQQPQDQQQQVVSPQVQSQPVTITPTGTPTGIAFFQSGHPQCATIVSCEGLGSATVTTITETLAGIHPSVTTVTITPTEVKPKGTNTVYVVPPDHEVGVAVISRYITPGETVTETALASPSPGSPRTVIIIPEGPSPSVKTVTSTLPFGHGGNEVITLGPQKFMPGIDATVTVIPADTKDVTVTGCPACCPAQQTVTIIQEPRPAPPINVTKPDGSIEQRPASKFPCSKDDRNPCRGTQVQGWTVFTCPFGGSRKWDGKTYPNPWKRSISFADDTILTVSDSWYQAEHWTITLDGNKLGETYEDGFKNNMLSCTANGDDCISKGFSHGSFWIPKGNHELEIEWTDGPLQYGGGYWWTHGYGVYRFDKPCSCSRGHDEL